MNNVHCKDRRGYPMCGSGGDAIWGREHVTCPACLAIMGAKPLYIDGFRVEQSVGPIGGEPDLIRSSPITPGPLTPESLRAAVDSVLTQRFEPIGLVLHPADYNYVDGVQRVGAVPFGDRRIEQQRAIADAFGIPHWIAGVDGAKPPVRIRLARLRRKVWRRLTLADWREQRRWEREDRDGWGDL